MDTRVFSVDIYFPPKKKKNIRQRILKVAESLSGFLVENDLTNADLNEARQNIDAEFAIHDYQLTDVGKALFENYFVDWMEKIDRGLDPEDVSYLESGLQRLLLE